MPPRKLSAFTTLLIVCTVSLACDDKRRHQPNDAVTVSNVATSLPVDASPKQVAEAMISALSDAQLIRVRGLGAPGQKSAYDAALARIYALAAKNEVHQQLLAGKSASVPRDVSPDAALTVMAESWISQIAHYAGGAKLDTLRIVPDPPKTDASVNLELESPADRNQLTRIESAVAANPPKKADGTPAGPGSAEYQAAIRQAAIKAGFSVPISASVDLRLRKTENGWRVTRITLSSGGRKPVTSTTPTQLPTSGK
ncbi:MAG: hypothetical protein HZA51_16600 [Planctomycetes bacterium]|nr:hypothetical protein [Planctomycetota bacterium]